MKQRKDSSDVLLFHDDAMRILLKRTVDRIDRIDLIYIYVHINDSVLFIAYFMHWYFATIFCVTAQILTAKKVTESVNPPKILHKPYLC